MTQAISHARTVLESFWDWKIPVDLNAIATKMGLRVLYPLEIDGDINISGKFCTEKDIPTCHINQNDTLHRQRVVLAYQIAHYCLKHGEQVDVYRIPDNSYKTPLKRDTEAFASELVMPKVAIDYFIQKKKMTSLSALAEKFDVSQVEMRHRLKSLNWL